MTDEEKRIENEKQVKELKRVYRRLFDTDDGKKVITDLERVCGFMTSSVCEQAPNPYQTAFSEGKRRVFLRILKMREDEDNE